MRHCYLNTTQTTYIVAWVVADGPCGHRGYVMSARMKKVIDGESVELSFPLSCRLMDTGDLRKP
jgi:hypothetical protein